VVPATACRDTSGAGAAIPASAFVGSWSRVWNYTQPDRQDDTNMAYLACPDGFSLAIPQIGWIAFGRPHGLLSATTDQGCTWTFADHGDRVQLSPASQSCFNKVIGSSYTLTQWDIAMHGASETEVIFGKSHQPGGDCDFTLPKGRRTRVGDDGPDPTVAFVGEWSYDASDSAGVNIEQVTCPGDVPGVFRPRLASGSVSITKTADHRIQAMTADGCTWTLVVSGNTAELVPPSQSCATGSPIRFWSMTSDGHRAASFMSGVAQISDVGCNFLLATGRLTKR
jgi:hypothetical protein